MIIDDLAQHSEFVRTFANEAHIIRVPFQVYQELGAEDGIMTLLNMVSTNIPKSISIQKEGNDEYCRPPYEKVILMSESKEEGALFVKTNQVDDNHYQYFVYSLGIHEKAGYCDYSEYELKQVDGKWNFDLIDEHNFEGIINRLADKLFDTVKGKKPDELTPEEHANLRKEVFGSLNDDEQKKIEAKIRKDMIIGMNAYGTYSLMSEKLVNAILSDKEEVIKLAAESFAKGIAIGDVIGASFNLLNCKNIQLKPARPTPEKINKKRQKNGKLPLFSYHTLVIKQSGGREQALSEATGDHVAVHWVRGHFKTYTDEKPLLGKYTGRYWWQPHLAGKAERIVDKEYEVKV